MPCDNVKNEVISGPGEGARPFIPTPSTTSVWTITHGCSCLSPENQGNGGRKGFGKWEVSMNRKARKGRSEVPQGKIKKQEG